MNVYVGHSRHYDYKNELYVPIQEGEFYQMHNVVLPHLKSDGPYDSKGFLETCDAMVAEVSYPSLGLGIEIGWASAKKVPVLAFHKEGSFPSASLKMVPSRIFSYQNGEELAEIINRELRKLCAK